MAQGAHIVTKMFEEELCKYTGAPFSVALDSCTSALFLSLYYEKHILKNPAETIVVPCRTYNSVPCVILQAGFKVQFDPVQGNTLKGPYPFKPTRVIDSALRFTADMYEASKFMCLSFTGPNKTLKLGKGGAILCDNYNEYCWFKRARFSGRREMSYHVEDKIGFDQLGWNFYLLPDIAAKGLLLMPQFYNLDGSKKHNIDLELPYPDLSKHEIYTR